MRKAALLIGIVCAVFVVLGAVLRVIGFPGSSMLFIIFASLFSFVSLGLFLGAAFRETTFRMRKISLVLFWFGLTDMQIGLLYGAMSWEGVATILVQAVVLILVALILFVLSAKQSGVTTKWNSTFTIVALIIYASLSVGWMTAAERRIFGAEHVKIYTAESTAYAAATAKLDREYAVLRSDTANLSLLLDADFYFNKVDGILAQIGDVKSRLIEQDNDFNTERGNGDAEVILHPEAYDFSTMLLVGVDVQHPTGRGMEICAALVDYRMNYLHHDVSFIIPVSNEVEKKEQWVKDNFYHVPVIDALTRLTVIQNNVVQSALESIEKKLFVIQQ